MAKLTTLNVWMNGLLVGHWRKTRTGETFQYAPSWLESEARRPLSLSMPFPPGNIAYRGALVTDYFDNLLPDSEPIRRRLASRYKTTGLDAFAMLAELGRDCVGAIQLLPDGVVPTGIQQITAVPLLEREIAALLRHTTSTHLLGRLDEEHDLRLSIAGAQEKTALLFHSGQWYLPQGNTPTTHIFKLPLGLVGGMRADMSDSVENEWLCSKIVAEYGLPIAHCDIGRFEDQKVLMVTRFDRRLASDGSWIIRLPQEDFAQATGTPAHKKYQHDGGPGVVDIMQILLGSVDPVTDRRNFFKTQLVFWLLAATDGHAKNFSLAHLPGNRFRATPLYDVLSAHPIIGGGANQIPLQKAKLAMGIRGSTLYYLINKIQRRHWIAQAQQVGVGEAMAKELIQELIEQTPQVIERVKNLVPAPFPQEMAHAIFAGLQRQADKLAAMPDALA